MADEKRIFGFELLAELRESGYSQIKIIRVADSEEGFFESFVVFPAHIFLDIALQMDETKLMVGFREKSFNCICNAGEII